MTEFDRQAAALGLPAVLAEPLRDAAAVAEASAEGRIPFLLVAAAPPLEALARIDGATSVLDAEDLARWRPIDGVRVPAGAGAPRARRRRRATRPAASGPTTRSRCSSAEGRSPLTLGEGIALVTSQPGVVYRNHGVQFPGSRCGDRRVTAIWLSEGRHKLGWCWAGNPHSWLGMASCAARWGA